MVLSIHQPNFIPWGGFWKKMMDSDCFVILDDAQYTKGSYLNRVKIGNGDWFTMPVNYKYGQAINEVKLHRANYHAKKLFKTIKQYYPKLKYYFEWLNDVPDDIFLIEFNMKCIYTIRDIMDINNKLLMSSDLGIHSTGSQRILEICQKLGSKQYLTGRGGRKYLQLIDFEKQDIDVELVNYGHKHEDITVMKQLNKALKEFDENK